MSTALHQCENEGVPSSLSLLQIVFHSGDNCMVLRCCVYGVYVSPSCCSCRNLSHSGHLYGFCPVWTLMWVFRCPDTLNALWHTWHLYGFSPRWNLLCLTRPPDCVNRLLQTLHSNGLFPEWIRLCRVKVWLLSHFLPHSTHLYLPLWTLLCRLNRLRDVKHFPHWLHVSKSPTLCNLRWSFKSRFSIKDFSRTVQTCGLGLCESRVCSLTSLLSAATHNITNHSPMYSRWLFLKTGNDQRTVMPLDGKSNRRSGIAPAMCRRLQWFIHNYGLTV